MRTKLTYLDYVALPEDGKRYELIDGELIEMAAPLSEHQNIVDELTRQVGTALIENRLPKRAQYHSSPFDIRLPDINSSSDHATTVVQPDLSVYCDASGYDRKGGKRAPDFAIEVLSPSSIKHDSVRKLQIYEAHRFNEYWIVDGELQSVSVYRHDGQGFAPVESFAFDCVVPVRSVPGLSIDLALLARVLDRAEQLFQDYREP